MVWKLTTCAFLVVALAAAAADAGAQEAESGTFPKISIRRDHPRIYLNEGRVKWLKSKVDGKSLDEIKALAGTSVEGLALVYVITGDEAAGRGSIDKVKGLMADGRRPGEVATAICYDWCYPLLTAEEKKDFAAYLVKRGRAHKEFGRGWRSFHNGLYSGSTRLAAVAIALYHDDPFGKEALDFLIPEWEDSMKVFERLFPDGEWPESFDYNRNVTYDAFRFYWMVKTASGVDLMATSEHMRNTALFIIYSTKPNGLVYPSDDNDWPHLGNWDREALLLAAAEFKDPYAQHVLNTCRLEEFQPYGGILWKDLLWYNPETPARSPEDLPRSRIFRGDGLVIARSGWGWDSPDGRAGDTWVTFRCGDYFGDHCHYDNNSFQIYYKGELALDSGRYDDDWGHYNDEKFLESQFFNYYQRTIAHNTILVYDPDEKFAMPIVNDGGQRQLLQANGIRNVPEDYEQGTFPSDNGIGTCDWATNPGRWETGDILAYKATSDFTYVCGDATKAYSSHKMKSFVRQFLFIQPDIIVVFDRVVSTKPEFKKTWLLHSMEEPRIPAKGAPYEISYGEGRLLLVPVLPENSTFKKVGGPGDEFLVGEKHFKAGLDSPIAPSALHYGELPGAWRLELSPDKSSEEDFFLNVLYLTDRDDSPKVRVEMTANDTDKVVLEVSSGSGKSTVVTFSKGENPSAHLRLADGETVLHDAAMPVEIVLEGGRP